jgi:hypothetical protein
MARDKKGTEKKTYTRLTKKQRIMEKGSRKNFIWKRERWFSYNQNVYMQKYTCHTFRELYQTFEITKYSNSRCTARHKVYDKAML